MSSEVPAPVAIVDDDPSVRRAFARLLRACDYPVETYASAEDFLATSDPSGIACLVVDVQMPGMTGLQLLEQLAPSGAMPPTLIITAYDDGTTAAQARRHGAGFLLKPFESATLLAAVGELIGRDLELGT